MAGGGVYPTKPLQPGLGYGGGVYPTKPLAGMGYGGGVYPTKPLAGLGYGGGVYPSKPLLGSSYGDGVYGLGDSYGDGALGESSYGDGSSYRNDDFFAGLGSETIMLLEGGPSGLEAAIFGNTEDQAGEDLRKPMPIKKREQCLKRLLDERRGAICQAHSEREVLQGRLDKLDDLITKQIVPALNGAIKRGQSNKAALLDAKLQKYDAVRNVVAGKAIRFAKTEAIGKVLAKNAKTQLNLVRVAAHAQKRGRNHAVKPLVAAAQAIGRRSEAMKTVRARQVNSFKVATAASTAIVGQALIKEAAAKISILQAAPKTPRNQQAIQKHSSKIQTLLPKVLNAAKAVPKTKKPMPPQSLIFRSGAPKQKRGRAIGRRLSGLEFNGAMGEAFLALGGYELSGLDFSFTGAVRSAAGAVTGTVKRAAGAVGRTIKRGARGTVTGVKRLGRAVKTGVKKIGAATWKALKVGACAIGKNPEVTQAVSQAAGGAVGTASTGGAGGGAGAQAGALAGKLASSIGKSACPPESTGGMDEGPTSSGSFPVVPVVAAGGGALLLLTLL